MEAAKEKMNEAISAKLSLDMISGRFIVADFGCASGPNTFVAVQNIINVVEDKYRKATGQNPAENIEFQVLFNDSTTNDFNTLFQALPAGRRYYSAGVPGSFFGRVLPKHSFHIGVISYAFHFTSKNPQGITDRDSPLWNRDMHCTGFNEAVKKAYLDQYSADTKNLLDARAEELVPGGLMLLLGSGLRDGVKMSETAKGIMMDLIGASLNDLAQQVRLLFHLKLIKYHLIISKTIITIITRPLYMIKNRVSSTKTRLTLLAHHSTLQKKAS